MRLLLDELREARRFIAPRWVEPPMLDVWRKHARTMAKYVGPPTRGEADYPILLADEVATYYWETNEQENWDLTKHFPNLTPPAEVFWIEHKLPHAIHSEGTVLDTGIKRGRLGALFIAADAKNALVQGAPSRPVRWYYVIELFLDYAFGRGIEGPHGSICLAVDADGAVIDPPWIQGFTPPGFEKEGVALIGWIYPALLAICWFNRNRAAVADGMRVEVRA